MQPLIREPLSEPLSIEDVKASANKQASEWPAHADDSITSSEPSGKQVEFLFQQIKAGL